MTARHWCCVLLLSGIAGTSAAQNIQLTIKSGTFFTVAPGCALALRNTDLHSDGTLAGPGSLLYFYGDTDQSLSTQVPLSVQALSLLKKPGSKLVLNTDVQASGLVNFSGGNLELNGYDLTVAGTGLQGENDTSRVTALNGGAVITNVTGFDAPNQADPGHLGAVITSSADWGNVTIRRLQKPFLFGQATSIQRSYYIEPQNNTGLHATLRFQYLDTDLDKENPATLGLWSSMDGITWTGYTPDSSNDTGQLRFVEKTDIDSFVYWTVADAANPLATLTLASFSAVCQDNYALLRWQTANEALVDHYEIERSTDGTIWDDLATISALNNLQGSTYSYKDNTPQAKANYRIKTVTHSGAIMFSPSFSGGCADVTLPLTGYPNPANADVTLRVGLRAAGQATLQVVDAAGATVFTQNWTLTAGANQVVVPLYSLAPGIYTVWLISKQGNYHARIIKK